MPRAQEYTRKRAEKLARGLCNYCDEKADAGRRTCSRCRVSQGEYGKRWAERNPGKRRATVKRTREKRRAEDRLRYVNRAYGLTAAAYEAMLERQDRRCLLCGKQPQILCVDHDHATGRVRGLLCRRCNAGLGHLRDDGTLIAAAIGYLLSHKRGQPHALA